MDRHQTILKMLMETSDDDWKLIMSKCKRLIEFRTGGKTYFGAHSIERLEMSPFDYYFQGALDKLYEGTWDWQFEKFSLSEQMCRVIGSMITDEVRKFKIEKNSGAAPLVISLEDVDFCLGFIDDGLVAAEVEMEHEKNVKIVEAAIQGCEDMELLFLCVLDGKSREEICIELSWEKRKLYKVTELMKTKVRKHNVQSDKGIIL